MNYLKQNPKGIDEKIQEAQVVLYDNLVSLWGVELDGYGRVYKNEKDGVVIPEIIIEGKDYSSNLFTRSNKFFFTKDSLSETDEYCFKTKVNIYFILDVASIKPRISHRADQEVQIDVVDWLEITPFHLKSIVDTDLDTVFKEFKGMYNGKKYDDMQPFHIFKCVCDVIYELKTRYNG